MTPTKISVVVVAFNSAPMLAPLLSSLPDAFTGVDYETIVVDNGSSDGSADVAESAGCHVIRSTNEGYAAGINKAVAASDAPYYMVLNPDTILEPGCARALLRAFDLPRTGVAAPLVLTEDGEWTPSLRREPTVLRSIGLTRTRLPIFSEYVLERQPYRESSVADWAVGAALLVSRACHDEIGGWDASYFLYSEETDFCLRARDLGYLTRFEPAAKVRHIGGASGRSGTTHAMQVINRVRFYGRRHGAVHTYLYFVANLVSEASHVLRGHPESRVAVTALLFPSRRPPQIGASDRMLPL